MKNCAALLGLLAALAAPLPVYASVDKADFAVVLTRHGVRSFTHTPPQYTWPDWSPVDPGFLTAHGYRLMTVMGAFYRRTLAAEGVKIGCRPGRTFVYADVDQRTLATGRALIEGVCGSPDALPLYHDAQLGGANVNDPLFDGADWLAPAGKIDRSASLAAVAAAAPNPPSQLLTRYAPEFAALQSLLDPRCTVTCPPVTSGDSTIVSTKKGLAALQGPVDLGSEYAESLFLQYAQCGPALDTAKLAEALRLHVLEYDVNARNAYAPLIKGGNMFAHLVGLLEEKAGMPHPDVTIPDVGAATVAMIAGHDTQLGAFGGILHAHWPLGNGMVEDDMPPGGALVFVLRRSAGQYLVHVKFAYPALAQFRYNRAIDGGVSYSPVRFPGCTESGDECVVPLATLAAIAHDLAQKGYVQREWTAMSDADPNLAPLSDPSWTACR
jgi:4-phytase/acid phosphatase